MATPPSLLKPQSSLPAERSGSSVVDGCRAPRVLVIGPGRRGRGGIDSVISLHTTTAMWGKNQCKWLETYDDRSPAMKILAALKALLAAPVPMIRSDIVHIHAAFRTSLLRKAPFLCLAKILRKKVVLHIHDYDIKYLDRAGSNSFAARMLRAADKVVALSNFWASILRTTGASVVVIPNPVSLPGTTTSAWKARRCPTILYVGKLENRKGYTDLLRAMPLVLQNHPNAKLRLAGHGELSSAKALANELSISNSVEVLGWVNRENRDRIYRDADVFCLPSYNEGVPMVILEAMSYRLPVVCTPVGGLPDLIEPGQNGVFVQPGRIDEIASALIPLLDRPDYRLQMGAAAFATVQRTCSLEVIARHLEQLYATLYPLHTGLA
jgi:glycosyltransferase involved in cell wall biosynthesis